MTWPTCRPGWSRSRPRCRCPPGWSAVIEVSLTTVTPVAAVVPKSTAVAPVKPVPVIVTEVPPAVGPVVGLRLVTAGAAGSVKIGGGWPTWPRWSRHARRCRLPAGLVAVIEVSLDHQ